MFTELDKVKLYYEQHGGQGKPLLLLHGWGCSTEIWQPLVRDFRGVRRLILIDFPGHGQSSEPPEPWSVTEYMELTARFIQNLSVQGCDIIAHSFGGRVALLLAATYPHLVGKLLLTGAAGLRGKPTAKQKMRSNLYKGLKNLYASAPITRVLGDKKSNQLRESLQQKFGSEDYKALTPSMRATFVRVVNQDLAYCLPEVKASTLLIWGENDTSTPLWMGQTMEQQIPDAGLVVFKDCGHYAFLEKYLDFYKIADHFLNQGQQG